MTKALYKYSADCGRMGTLEGLFIDTKQRIDYLIQSDIEVYFGEVLGKHSEVFGEVEAHEIEFVTSEPKVIEVIEEFKLQNGFNPMGYETINFPFDDEIREDMTTGEIIDILLEREK